eukprot:2033447-Rhodomonas_salina.1
MDVHGADLVVRHAPGQYRTLRSTRRLLGVLRTVRAALPRATAPAPIPYLSTKCPAPFCTSVPKALPRSVPQYQTGLLFCVCFWRVAHYKREYGGCRLY